MADGGTIWDVNISSAVSKCNELGFPNDKIIIDTAICLNTQHQKGAPAGNTVRNYLTAREIKLFYRGVNNVDEEERAAPGV